MAVVQIQVQVWWQMQALWVGVVMGWVVIGLMLAVISSSWVAIVIGWVVGLPTAIAHE